MARVADLELKAIIEIAIDRYASIRKTSLDRFRHGIANSVIRELNASGAIVIRDERDRTPDVDVSRLRKSLAA